MDDGSTGSDGTDKSWDHPWCTEEIRKKRREWSLAGDAGLLKHLQSFSKNLTTKATQTQGALDSLTNRLNETAIFIDNLTNTSLALANTQFIESRVQEDDVEVEKPANQLAKNVKDREELSADDVLASVNASIKEGLRIVDEKYEQVDVVASDSEDEGESTFPSVVLRSKDPYQDRPLPYVIGSEKWKTSNKIGLESSSSESEQMEEEDEESSSHTDDNEMADILCTNNRQKTLRSRLSSASIESNDYNLDSNSARDTNNGSLRAKSQDTLNLESEPMTPTSVLPKSQSTNIGPPSFAEELAKRLGSVLPSHKTVVTQESNNSSINSRSKDDLFAQEDDVDVFNVRSENLFSGGGGLFDDDSSTTKWNITIPKPVKTNMIPPSIDVPPPISSTSTKSKSAFDDLFGDADSEDSDDIFSTKSVKPNVSSYEKLVSKAKVMDKKYLTSDFAENMENMATSTPETHDDVPNLFGDDELNAKDLFSTSKPRNRVASETPPDKGTRKKPIGGVSVFGGVNILSSKLPNKIFRQSSSDSSSSETASNNNSRSNKTNSGAQNAVPNDNIPDSSPIVAASNVSNADRNLENSTNSSGISIQPSSISNADGSRLGVDFQPQMTSTRLKSEEIYRERRTSDSLYAAPSKLPDIRNSNSSSSVNETHENRVEESSRYQDDIFDDDDVFGPPPLPKDDAKKSKVISLFDDSDSEDKLFFSSVSKSRSQKSVDISTKPQFQVKLKPSKKISIFDDDDDEDDDIFGTKDSNTKPENYLVKATSLFDDSDKKDLFGSSLSRKGTKVLSIFDDDTDLPTESLKPSSSIMGTTPSDLQTTVENSSQNIFASSEGGLFDDDDEDGSLFGQKAPLAIKVEENSSQMKTNVSDREIVTEPKVDAKTPPKMPQKPDDLTARGNQAVKKKTNENVVDGACVSKRDPPKTLNIHSLPPLTTEESSQVPRREMSGKIKDISRRLGSLKILSPTDTPPILNKNEEKNKDEEESLEGDSENGGSLSVPSSGKETNVSVDSLPRKESPESTSITIDELLMNVETLTTASKSRVRIPVKRRPQSRRARQTALHQSGLDFDAVDSSKDPDIDQEGIEKDKEIGPSSATTNDSSERLMAPTIKDDDKADNPRNTVFSFSLATDTANKNTLLSPSTDEEDLFDAPPELSEDPFREDSLFGRAPIMSPVDDTASAKDDSSKTNTPTLLKVDKVERQLIKGTETEESEAKLDQKVESPIKKTSIEREFSHGENNKSPLDPLRDGLTVGSSIDPSQLFAFVTKTPSPEKSKALLFNEDDSLFSSASSQASEKSAISTKKTDLLFVDSGEDLFSAPLVKSGKKPLKDTKLRLFHDETNDQEEEEDSLFGSTTKKSIDKIEPQKVKSCESSKQNSVGQKGLFESNSEEQLFAENKEKIDVSIIKIKTSNVQDIFGDQSSGEEDLFAFKKTIPKKSTIETKSLFDDDDNDDGDDIFGKPTSSMSKATESRASIKQAVTRDLKKNAEQIVEDPLTMLQDD